MFLKSIFAFIAGHIMAFFGGNTEIYVATETPKTAETTISTSTETETKIDSKVDLATTTPTKVIKEENKSTSTPKKAVEKIVKQEEPQIIQIPIPDFEKLNTSARNTVVNILCTTKFNSMSPITGTGVIVSEDGVILTNAHVGQYFLLKDYAGKDSISCVARTGSPAYPEYNIELIYISPTWVKDNSSMLKSQNPTGTGENDFAFLKITGRIDGSALKDKFSYLQPNTREFINKNEPVLLVSYPAGFLGGISVLKDLNISSSITNIQDYFTFKENTIDLISVGGTVVSQKGSSGGAVVDIFSALLGIISTSSDGNTTDKRDLRAITLAHINRSLQKELVIDIFVFLKKNTEIAESFKKVTSPELTKILEDVIKS